MPAMKAIVSHLEELLTQKRRRDGGPRITYGMVEAATGVPLSTISDLDKNELTEFPEVALIALCDYLECPLAGPDGLLEIIDVPEQHVPERRKKARQRL